MGVSYKLVSLARMNVRLTCGSQIEGDHTQVRRPRPRVRTKSHSRHASRRRANRVQTSEHNACAGCRPKFVSIDFVTSETRLNHHIRLGHTTQLQGPSKESLAPADSLGKRRNALLENTDGPTTI